MVAVQGLVVTAVVATPSLVLVAAQVAPKVTAMPVAVAVVGVTQPS